MKSRLQFNIKKYFCFILIASLLVAFLAGCRQSTSEIDGNSQDTSLPESHPASATNSSSTESETSQPGIDPNFDGDIISMALYLNPEIDKTALSMIQGFVKEQMESSNQYLESTQRDYRLSFEILQVDYESFDGYQDYNIILNMPYFLSESFVEEHFLELTEELYSGSLIAWYQSEPEIYWKTVEQNGKIFNPLTQYSEIADALWFDMDALEEIGISEHDLAPWKGKPLLEWLPLFETIYQANDNQPFLENPLQGGGVFTFTSTRTPVLRGIGWDAHFQIIAPMIGISYEEPEKGAQFLLESAYAEQIIAFWKELEEKGYIVNQDDLGEKNETGPTYPLVWYRSTNSTEIVKRPDTSFLSMEEGRTTTILICPLQEQLHSFCRSAWDESRYYFLIPKNQENLSLTFTFLNDMATDSSFAYGIMLGLEPSSTRVQYKFSSIVREFCDKTYLEEPEQRFISAAQTTVPCDAGFVYTPSDAASLQKGVGFEYMNVYGNPFFNSNVFTMNTSEDWLHFDERLETLKAMYHEEGIDEMVAEANEQLAQFRKQP